MIRSLMVAAVLTIAAPAAAQDAFDLSRAVLDGGSPSVVDRAPAATITQVNFTVDGVVVDFTKRDGVNRWPDVVPPGWDGPIQYTLWIGMQIQGQWHVCGILEFWFGRGLNADLNAGSNATTDQQVQRNWTYFCGPMARQPNPGEPIAFMVTAGDQRRMDIAAVRERSNVVIVPFPASAPAVFPIGAAPVPTPTPTPPPVVIAPPPPVVSQPPNGVVSPLPATDLSPVLGALASYQAAMKAQLADLRAQVAAAAADAKAFREEVESTWSHYAGPILKYATAIVVGVLAKWKFL